MRARAPADVDYLNAHGTSTPMNDKSEAAAAAVVFGDRVGEVAVSSTKSVMGHLIAAAGAVEAVVCALSITHSLLPVNANLREVDPDCAHLDIVRDAPRERRVRVALSNSFGFGGSNSCLAFRHPDETAALIARERAGVELDERRRAVPRRSLLPLGGQRSGVSRKRGGFRAAGPSKASGPTDVASSSPAAARSAPPGRSAADIVDAALEGRSAIAEIESFDASAWPRRYAAEVKDYDANKLAGDRKVLKLIRRSDVFGLHAAAQAIAEAGFARYRETLDEDARHRVRAKRPAATWARAAARSASTTSTSR